MAAGPKPPPRQSITPPRSSGTAMISRTNPQQHGLGNNPASSSCRRVDPVAASSPSTSVTQPGVVTPNARQHPDATAIVSARAEVVDRDTLARLVASISLFLAIPAAGDGDMEGLDCDGSVECGYWTGWVSVGASLRWVAAGRRVDGHATERVLFSLVAQRALEFGSKRAATGWVAERVGITGCRGFPTMRCIARWTFCSTRWARSLTPIGRSMSTDELTSQRSAQAPASARISAFEFLT